MAEEETKDRAREQAGLRFAGLGMNVVPAAVTQEPSEVRHRASIRWLWLVAVLAVVAVVAYGAKTFLNMPPGQQAEQRLRDALARTEAWGSGMVMKAQYTAADRIRIEYGTAALDPATVRKATIEVMKVFMQERPGRDLYIDGYRGDHQVASAEYRQKGGIRGEGGRIEPDIRVKVEGEAEGGIGQLVKPSGRAAPGP